MAYENAAFNAELMAPCGMNCALCSHYLAYLKQREGPHRMAECRGCAPSARQCTIKKSCEWVRLGKIRFCAECAEFPCPPIQHIDARYRNRYSYSMIGTLRDIDVGGITRVLLSQREQHRCQRCGGVVCIHNGKCYCCDEVASWRG